MKKNYYAVKIGRVPGIYTTWAECQKNVTGFSGAVFQGFVTLEEAKVFLEKKTTDIEKGMNKEEKNSVEMSFQKKEECGMSMEKNQGAVAYVDGSYFPQTKEYSYGVVLFYQGREEHFKEKFSNPQRAAMRNVAGEIEGSMCAMEYCLHHKIPSLTIYYDYEGIEKWCTGVWKATKEGTMAYRDFYHQAKEQIEIRFVKVKGHSGDVYNDLADALAKEALGL